MTERIKFEGSWRQLLPRIEEAIQKNERLEIALPREEYDRLRKLNGPFFRGKGLRKSDLPEDIWRRLFLVSGNAPYLLVGHSV